MNGWWWLIAAFVLAGVELLVPGWAFMGLAAAVGLMGILMLAGLWSAGLPLTLVVTALLWPWPGCCSAAFGRPVGAKGASGTATSTTDRAGGRVGGVFEQRRSG